MLEEKNKKNVLLVVFVILALIVFGFYYFIYKNKAYAPGKNTDIVTTVQKENVINILNTKSPAITKTEKLNVKGIISKEVSTQTLSKEEKTNILNILNN